MASISTDPIPPTIDPTPIPAPAPVAGQKRKRAGEKKYYAVKVGKQVGVYDTWTECLAQVTGQKGASFKSFTSYDDAQAFVEGRLVPPAGKPGAEQKFYAVSQGKIPGVYTDWPTAQAQISGFKNPRHKKFSTRAEAEAFVNEGKRKSAYDVGVGINPEEEIRRLITKTSAPGMITSSMAEYPPRDRNGDQHTLGHGPLPDGAEDGYDPNIKLEDDGTIRQRTLEEKQRTKPIPRETDPPSMLKIYTDGSSLKNGQIGARAGVGVFFGPQDPQYGSPPISASPSSSSSHEIPIYTIDWRARGAPSRSKRPKLTWRYRNVSEALKGSKQTNQRAELTAIQRALDIAPSHRDVTIYTDSRYAIDCVTNWYKGWRQNGWTNSKGKPVENRDLVQEIRLKIEERDVFNKVTYFVWVKGHAADPGNVAADRLAVAGAMSGIRQQPGQIGEGEDTLSGSGDDEDEDEEEEDEAGTDSDEDDRMDYTGDVDADRQTKESLRLMRESLNENRHEENQSDRGVKEHP